MIELRCGDCLEVMQLIKTRSVHMILCDLPYGTTSCKWDAVIPFKPLWKQYERIIKPGGTILLHAGQPFTSALIMSNQKGFKYCWYWKKNRGTGFQNAKRQPLRVIEEVCVFNSSVYYPQGLVKVDRVCHNSVSAGGESLRVNVEQSKDKGSLRTQGYSYIQEFTGYPNNILEFSTDRVKLHPTQKPLTLAEYLIRTYSRKGDVVMDNCMGSGTTGVACINTKRSFVGIELDETYFALAEQRVSNAKELSDESI